MLRKNSRLGRFTLVELLTVVAIILILVAMLLPMLEKARYQAMLVVCASNLHQSAVAVTAYAGSYDRFYPHRPLVDAAAAPFPSTVLASANHNGDDRGVFKDFLTFDANSTLHCPLSPNVNLAVDPPPNISVNADYNMWFGWTYKIGPGTNSGMRRIGDKIVYSGFPDLEFDVLLSDYDEKIFGVLISRLATHPDLPGTLKPVAHENNDFYFGRNEISPANVRGNMDMNFVRGDGSVRAVRNVPESGGSDLVFLPRETGIDLGWKTAILTE